VLPRTFSALVVLVLPCIPLSSDPRRGQVLDEHGPVPEARVRVKGTSASATTDADGRFELRGTGERVTAWKSGYFISGASAAANPLTLRLRPLPKEDNPEYAWVDPTPSVEHNHNCGNCHGAIHDEWAASAHGRSGTNKRFRNLYDGTDWHGKPDVSWNLLKELPTGASVCIACHAPATPFNHPGFEDFRKLDGVHVRGVHCDYCHKIADAATDKLGLEHGRFAHTLLRPKNGQLFFGPLDDVDRDEDTFAPLYTESRYCASCHEGTIFGTKVYTTYSEWLESPARKAGKQCQSCHMAPTGKMANFAPGRGGIERDPRTLASHRMPGADLAMLRSCLRVSVELSRDKEELKAQVEVVAVNVGHRVPTGFIDRQLILVIEPLAAKGAALRPGNGPKLPEAASDFAGLAGRLFARQIEDDKGHPVPFWRPNRATADTRLQPEVADRSSWRFPAAEVTEVRVRLIYRRFHKSVADAKRWPDNEIAVVDKTLAAPRDGLTATWRSE
jgi:cytochrome c554/c'-like protein